MPKSWTDEDIEDLEIGYINGLQPAAVAHHLDRQLPEVVLKAQELGLIESPPLVPKTAEPCAPMKRIPPTAGQEPG
jgi:hypothetical protein